MADKKRRNPFDDDFFGGGFFGEDVFGEEFSSRIRDMMRRMMSGMEPDDLKEGNPVVYGFNFTMGPEGKPVVREFGNVKPTMKGTEVSDKREPLLDVIEREKEVTVIAELPGVEKHQVKLKVDEDVLTISAEGNGQEYFKKVKLPVPVKNTGSKATYKNGVLEVRLERKTPKKEEGSQIKVE